MSLIKWLLGLPFKILNWIFSPVFMVVKLVIGIALISFGIWAYFNQEEAKQLIYSQSKEININEIKNKIVDTTKNNVADIKEALIKNY